MRDWRSSSLLDWMDVFVAVKRREVVFRVAVVAKGVNAYVCQVYGQKSMSKMGCTTRTMVKRVFMVVAIN